MSPQKPGVATPVSANYLGVDAVGVVDGAVVLDDADAGGSGAHEITASVQAHVTEALHDESLATPSGSRAWNPRQIIVYHQKEIAEWYRRTGLD